MPTGAELGKNISKEIMDVNNLTNIMEWSVKIFQYLSYLKIELYVVKCKMFVMFVCLASFYCQCCISRSWPASSYTISYVWIIHMHNFFFRFSIQYLTLNYITSSEYLIVSTLFKIDSEFFLVCQKDLKGFLIFKWCLFQIF